jgi:hypothetical protein
MSGCGSSKELKAEANKIVDAVSNNDVEQLNTIIFESEGVEIDEELSDLFQTIEESDDTGLISKIIAQDTIKLESVSEDMIKYKIISPDLSNVFQDLENDGENLTEDNFEQYLVDYINNAEKINTEVEVAYTYDDGIFDAEYKNEDFINALTGNMLTSYQTLIQDMLLEFTYD